MINNESKKGTLINALMAAGLTALFFILIFAFYSFTYGKNDDAFILQMLNGAVTGSPDAHVVYIKYPLAVILAGLFEAFPAVNWHYGLLISCFVVCVFLVNFRILSNCKKVFNKIILSLIFMLAFAFCLTKIMALTHYTTCAAVLSATGIFWFATIKYDSEKAGIILNYIAGLLLLFTAYALRARTLLMLLPLAFAVFIYKLLKEKKVFTKKNILRWIIFPVILFAGIGGIELIHNMNYRTEEWKKFISFNDARTTLYDFYGLPSYEGNEEMYESLGVDESRQYMYEQYYLEFTDGTDEKMLEGIAQYRVKQQKEKYPLGERIKYLVNMLPEHAFKNTYAPLNVIVIALFIVLLVLSACFKKKRAVFYLASGFVMTLIPWCYVILMGKPTSRVIFGIWTANFLLLIALLIDNADDIRKMLSTVNTRKRQQIRILKILSGVFAALALFLGIALNYNKTEKSINKVVSSGLLRAQIEEWCLSNPENLYIYDSETFGSLEFDMRSINAQPINAYWPGGWSSKMANMKKLWSRYGIEDIERAVIENDNIFIIALNDTDVSYWERFYKMNYGECRLKKTGEEAFGKNILNIYSLSR